MIQDEIKRKQILEATRKFHYWGMLLDGLVHGANPESELETSLFTEFNKLSQNEKIEKLANLEKEVEELRS